MIDITNIILKKPVLFGNENKYDKFMDDLIEVYNEEYGTDITKEQIKGLVAVETKFIINKKDLARMIDKFFELFKKFNFKGIRKIYAMWKEGKIEKKEGGQFKNQLYVDLVFAYNDFYYARDVKKDIERAKMIMKRIHNLELRDFIERNAVFFIVSVLLLIIFIIMIIAKK